MRTFAMLMASLVVTGCAVVATGRAPEPSAAAGIEIHDSKAAIELTDYVVIVEQLEDYSLNLGAVGVLVPIIPLWTSGEHLRLAIALEFHPKTRKGEFKPGSLRVVVDEEEYVPSSIKVQDHCGGSGPSPEAATVEPTSSIRIAKPLCVWFSFDYLRPPDEDFSLVVAKGFPVVRYTMKRHTHGGIFVPHT